MEEANLKMLIENELYSLVLVNSEDELAKITYDSVNISVDQFIGRYKQLTDENINFLKEYIWTVINKMQNKRKEGKEI